MTIYNCQRCNYTTIQKANFRRHLLRKKLCKPILKELTKIELYTLHLLSFPEIIKEIDIMSSECHPKCHPNVIRMSSDTLQKRTKKILCKFCNKEFTNRQSKSRHELNRCFIKKQLTDIKLENEFTDLRNTVEKLLIQHTSMNYNNTNSNNINSNNIIINNFGKEKIDYISNNMYKKLINMPMVAISKMIELKHFHKNHPENHNIKINNLYGKYGKIYRNNKWETEFKKELVDNIVDYCFINIEEFKNDNHEILTKKLLDRFNRVEDKYNKRKELLNKQAELTIYNNSKIVNDIEV